MFEVHKTRDLPLRLSFSHSFHKLHFQLHKIQFSHIKSVRPSNPVKDSNELNNIVSKKPTYVLMFSQCLICQVYVFSISYTIMVCLLSDVHSMFLLHLLRLIGRLSNTCYVYRSVKRHVFILKKN